MSHTPGPWKASERFPNCNKISSDDYGTIAWVPNEPAENKAIMETYQANAHLIAAAPDLLKSCKFFMAHIESGLLVRNPEKDSQSGWGMRMMKFVKDLKDAQLAIAKAEEK